VELIVNSIVVAVKWQFVEKFLCVGHGDHFVLPTVRGECDLQVLYNIRPQVITASNVEGTAYDVTLKGSQLTRRTKMRPSALSIRRHWPLIFSLLATSIFLLLRQHRQMPSV